MWYIQIIEYYTEMNINEPQIHAITLMTLTDIWSKRSQIQRAHIL
jgi:hypothetical protein